MKFYCCIFIVLAWIVSCLALPVQHQNERLELDPELSAGFFEGDMILDDDNRNGLRNESYRWPNNIVYYHIQRNIDEAHRNHILRGIRVLEDNSCLIFKEAATDQEYYVNVTSEPGGCFSTVGYRNRIQVLNLQDNEIEKGCFRLGTIVHEFLHALGFYHQQSAADRDEFVRIVEENVQDGRIHNFNKYSESVVDDYGIEYDYGSVMHYGPYAFSANGEMTIVPLKEGADQIMGQRLRISESDIKKLNLMYRCPIKV